MIFNLDQMVPYKNQVKEAIDRVIERQQYIYGEEIKAFEKEWALFTKQQYAIGVGNGTDAIRIALQALGVKPGDEVISTAFNVAYTAQAVASIGAVNVFCDVDHNLLINTYQIRDLITSRTRVILPVHLFGCRVPLEVLKDIVERNGLIIVEDAAQAHGLYGLGQYSHAVAYSHYPTKNLGCLGEGGSITTNIPIVEERAKLIRDAGRTDRYVHVLPGVNSCLDEIQAAILRVKLRYLIERNKARLIIAQNYDRYLKHVGDIKFISNGNSVYHLYVIRTSYRDKLHEYLKSKNIPTLIHYPVIVPRQPVFNDIKGSWPIAEEGSKTALSLPMHPDLAFEEQKAVIENIKNFYDKT